MDVPDGGQPFDPNNLLKTYDIFIPAVKNECRLDEKVSGYFTACKRLPFRSSSNESREIRVRSEKTGFIVNERRGVSAIVTVKHDLGGTGWSNGVLAYWICWK
jgi:hypothetical protein